MVRCPLSRTGRNPTLGGQATYGLTREYVEIQTIWRIFVRVMFPQIQNIDNTTYSCIQPGSVRTWLSPRKKKPTHKLSEVWVDFLLFVDSVFDGSCLTRGRHVPLGSRWACLVLGSSLPRAKMGGSSFFRMVPFLVGLKGKPTGNPSIFGGPRKTAPPMCWFWASSNSTVAAPAIQQHLFGQGETKEQSRQVWIYQKGVRMDFDMNTTRNLRLNSSFRQRIVGLSHMASFQASQEPGGCGVPREKLSCWLKSEPK